MLTLSIQTDDRRPVTTRVERLPCRIGKHRDNEVVLPSWRVARVHAEIHRLERGFKLVDCGSIGGTLVNGERIVEYGPLDVTDEITIAGFHIRIEPAGIGRDTLLLPGAAGAGEGGFAGAATEADAGLAGIVAAGSAPVTPSLADIEIEWRRAMHRKLLHVIDLRRKDVRQFSEAQLRHEARGLLVDLLAAEEELPGELDRERLIQDILDEAIGLGPLEKLLVDPSISEVMVNAPDQVFIERHGRLERTGVSFTGDQAIRAVIDRIVAPLGRRIDESSPMVDARLADGSRVNAIVPPLAIKGPTITIRRFNRRQWRPHELVAMGCLSAPMMAFLEVCVTQRRNLIVSGGTGSGKTTLLNVLSELIPDRERLVTIEDAAELRLHHQNLVSLEARPANAEGRGAVTIRDLVRNSLRMRPDRIIVGECRGGEALDMLQAMNTGHDGSLTTLHANSSRDVVSRLETMVLMSGVELPVAAIRDQIASAIDIIVHQSRLSDGSRRISEIVEVTGVEAGRIQMQPLFRLARRGPANGQPPAAQPAGDWRFQGCGQVPQFYEALRQSGLTVDLSVFGEGQA